MWRATKEDLNGCFKEELIEAWEQIFKRKKVVDMTPENVKRFMTAWSKIRKSKMKTDWEYYKFPGAVYNIWKNEWTEQYRFDCVMIGRNIGSLFDNQMMDTWGFNQCWREVKEALKNWDKLIVSKQISIMVKCVKQWRKQCQHW